MNVKPFAVPSVANRYAVFFACIVLALIFLVLVVETHRFWLPLAIFLGLVVVGVVDVLQRHHAVLRNYPVIGHARFLFEAVRPELRQYLFEDDDAQLPFSRTQRSLVYQRAKDEPDERPFGTLLDVYAAGYEFIGHSMRPAPVRDPATFRVRVGNDQCTQPYDTSVLNISAMSFGALSANAIRALNKGAKLAGFAQDTGEGSVSAYHLENGGDLIWQIASGYFGCRTADGRFDPEKFARRAADPHIKMIELKLSQGAKPGHGGILPADKVSVEIAETRGVPVGVACISPARHSSFETPIGMMEFLAELRRLSGGKPVGFKLAVGHPWEFMSIVKAMLHTGIVPDFIVVDGSEGGTGAAPVEFTDHIGVPMREALLLVHNTLVGAGLRSRVRIGASGKIISAFDIAATLAIGADWVNSARGFMFAVGCIQSLSCHTNKCPTGVATQDKLRQRALVVPDKAERVARFHDNTMHALAEMLAAAGLNHPSELAPHHLARRVSATEIRLFSDLHRFLKPGELLTESNDAPFYTASWRTAQAESFDPLPS
ncbi:FMN-binding glutamate synthase family protein [Kaistia dalseonensis]|uniref:Glutamate synthase domain-containing protein 2 n=1 Tax=Kaistia dalseonensis TaxID=410840 RepID=A0ABU0H6G6_9HYPH|nr:FMN-binding glutamate synthase family protein [Kaistia dalseonensis]MCX5495311.1 FMN-binding glutamate synthase family protein [Kaistia dalseonensis]MDQ0437897.1 glutamate synthase domain-containing protein 2 [Kaistia dalseonensis]